MTESPNIDILKEVMALRFKESLMYGEDYSIFMMEQRLLRWRRGDKNWKCEGTTVMMGMINGKMEMSLVENPV